jgi:hypothetical protein
MLLVKTCNCMLNYEGVEGYTLDTVCSKYMHFSSEGTNA